MVEPETVSGSAAQALSGTKVASSYTSRLRHPHR
jgi:hypothetical protein